MYPHLRNTELGDRVIMLSRIESETRHDKLPKCVHITLGFNNGPLCFPFSMLITHDDLVKISDFGTSRELSEKSTKMSFAGTVAWMAPEVIRNEPVSEKVDIW